VSSVFTHVFHVNVDNYFFACYFEDYNVLFVEVSGYFLFIVITFDMVVC